MRELLRVAGVAITSCGPAAPTTTPASAPGEVELDWSMRRDGETLRIDYVVKNDTPRPIFLFDRLFVGDRIAADATIVMDADVPGTVAFRRGFVRATDTFLPSSGSAPAARVVSSGGLVRGSSVVELPLRAWHNEAPETRIAPLTPNLTHAVLELDYSRSRDAYQGFGSNHMTRPRTRARVKRLRGNRQSLPAGVASRSGAGDAVPEIEWELAVNDGRLVISYQITNDTATPILVYDILERRAGGGAGLVEAPDAMITLNAETPGMVAFMRSRVAPLRAIHVDRYPKARTVGVGETARGRGVVSLPLAAWHNLVDPAKLEPIPATVRTAVLEIGYLPVTERGGDHRILRGPVKALPPGVTTR